MTVPDLIATLAARGQYHFTTQEAAQATRSSLTAARAALRRLKQKGHVAAPYRGFHVIVPPEYRRLGCLPADQFIPQLMEHLGLTYYVALLSAARYHGAAHQQPQVFQVIVQKNRPALVCGEVQVQFVARRNAGEIPTIAFNTPRGQVDASTPEATAFDLVGYPEHAGGLDNVATTLVELLGTAGPERLAAIALLSPVPWSQRLGYLLSLVGLTDCAGALGDYVARFANETVLLDPRRAVSSVPRDGQWKIIPNVKVDPEL
jgi:predicted transcriptional regulator of viral defense system